MDVINDSTQAKGMTDGDIPKLYRVTDRKIESKHLGKAKMANSSHLKDDHIGTIIVEEETEAIRLGSSHEPAPSLSNPQLHVRQHTDSEQVIHRNIMIQARAARKIQRAFRLSTTRSSSNLLVMSSSATLIQSAWRRFSARLQFRFDLSDIVFIQSLVRKKLAMKSIWQRKGAIITIQRFIR